MEPNKIFVITQRGIDETPDELKGKYSDGFHAFDELYEVRKALNAVLFNEWAYRGNAFQVHKSIRHNDGELCFCGGWFIVSANLPDGQISFHYKMEDWDLFQVPAKDKAMFKYDEHTTNDVIQRLKNLISYHPIMNHDSTGNK